jgi:RNA polymerase sigma factor (sigma-70 family)
VAADYAGCDRPLRNFRAPRAVERDVTKPTTSGVPGYVNALASTWPRSARVDRGFDDVVEACVDDVHRYLVMLTGQPTVAEDLTAETFEKALRSWRRFDPRRGSERAWLFGIARRKALDHFRAEARRRRREEAYSREAPTAAEPPLGGFSPELDAALRSLTAAEREVVALRVVLDLNADTAARLLGIGRTACSMRLARALHKLEERMERHALA